MLSFLTMLICLFRNEDIFILISAELLNLICRLLTAKDKKKTAFENQEA
jgi:hypothetical protein